MGDLSHIFALIVGIVSYVIAALFLVYSYYVAGATAAVIFTSLSTGLVLGACFLAALASTYQR